MAKYNREFLVPYLKNICALSLANKKICDRGNEISRQIKFCETGRENPIPDKPVFEPAWGDLTGLGIFFLAASAAIVIFLGIFLNKITYRLFDLNIVGYTIGGLILLYIPIYVFPRAKDAKRSNKHKEDRYSEQLNDYERREQFNASLQRNVPKLKAEYQECNAERQRLHLTLKKAYNANIIPSQYRNVYAAVYLYQWFSTSQADDLDMALNMFVLEEIKSKLDQIIANQGEMILNQYMMQANQKNILESQRKHNHIMHSKLDQIAASNEERNTYLSMIESNTAATAYFAAADYLRKL